MTERPPRDDEPAEPDARAEPAERDARAEPTERDARAERAERANYHVEADRRRRARESAKAQDLVERFVAEASAAGLVTTELTARPWSGRGRYRTGVTGWYLRRDHSVGVGVDGGYYVLVVPTERFGRWRRVTIAPSDPPLQVGQGARDGESIALAALLELRLAAGTAFD